MGDTLDFILIALMWAFALLIVLAPIAVIAIVIYGLSQYFSHKALQETLEDDVGVCEHCGDTKDWCRQC
jgi:hypothetical protein